MITIKDYYKKDCDREENEEKCKCRPSSKYGEEKLCSFSKDLLITDLEVKNKLLLEFGYKFPKDHENEAMAYIKEFPLYLLKKGSVLCHSVEKSEIFQKIGTDILIFQDGVWWTKYYVGQQKYNGGWFTYETPYGGPNFGVNLYYKVEQDIPLLFVPNYRMYLEKDKHKQYYFPPESMPLTSENNSFYSGSHIVKGPYNWLEKGFPEITPEYFADEFAERLVSLGFFGYISCDECEVFLTHKTMEKAMYNKPFKFRFSPENRTELNEQIMDAIYTMLSDENEYPLRITEIYDRAYTHPDPIIWDLEAVIGDQKESIMSTDNKGNVYWKKNGKLHREDGPAVELINGEKQWWQNGKQHRENGPAVIYPHRSNLVEKWYRYGQLHRINGPAIIHSDKSEEWYRYGELHRTDGPAVIKDGRKIEMWYSHGNKHREDGPAIINNKDGIEEWYNEGRLHREDGPAVINHKDRLKIWYDEGKLHRKGGPAIERGDGSKEWYENGKLHREGDLPAIERGDNSKEWYDFGVRHRKRGPAVVRADGTEEWYNNGKLHRKHGPAVINYKDGIEEWYNHGRLHRENGPAVTNRVAKLQQWYVLGTLDREDGPAVIYDDGKTQIWYKNGKLHRKGGPAVERADGSKEW